MEPVIPNEEFSNHGVSYEFLKSDAKFDELMEDKNNPSLKIHQLPHMQNMAQTLVEIQQDFFGSENNFTLKENCVAAASDVHGDFMALLGNLTLPGACTVDPTNFVLVDIDTGEIYDTEEKMTEAIQKSNNGELKHFAYYDVEFDDDGTVTSRTPVCQNNRLIYLPRIEKNPNFKGEINILGDYIDRGNEDLQNLAIIYYAKKLGINVNFILGNHEVIGAGGRRTKDLSNKRTIINMLKKDILKPLYINGNTVWEHAFLTQENLPVMFNSIKNLLNNNMLFDDQDYNQAFKTAQNLFADKLNLNENEDLKNKLSQLINNLDSVDFIFNNLYEKNYAQLIKSLASMYNEPNFLNFMEENISTLNLSLSDENPLSWNDNDINLINEAFKKNTNLQNIFFGEFNNYEVWKNCILANSDFEKLYKILTENYQFSDIDFFRLKNILIYSTVVSDLHKNFNYRNFANFDENQDEDDIFSNYNNNNDNYIIASMFIGKYDGNCGYLLAERNKGHFFKDINQNYGHTPSNTRSVEIDNNNKLTKVDIAANYTFNSIDAKLNDNAKYSSLIGVTLFDESGNTEYFTYKAYRGTQNNDGFYELTTNKNGVKFESQPPTKPFYTILYADSEKEYEFNKQKILDNFYENNSIENDINASKSILPEPKVDDIDTNIDNNDGKGVSPQELKDANLNFPIFEDLSAKKLVKSGISQIEHVMNIVNVTCNVVNDFRKPILDKYPDIKQEQIALPEGYVSNASDYHGDLTAFLSQLLFAGAITIDKNRLVAVDLDTGKIYSTLDEITGLHRQIENGKLTHYNEGDQDDINNRIVYLPYTEINPNFKGRINFLGDYLDRGAESQFILGYIEYLSQLNKQTENPINMKFFLGNHDVPGVCGGADRNKIMPSNPYYENVIKRMLYDEDIFEVCDVVKNENGTFNSYSHTLFTILNLPEMFNLLKVFLDENANIKDYVNKDGQFFLDEIVNVFNEARKYFIDKFMNADEKSLPKDYVNLRNKINKLKDQLKNLELRTKEDGGLVYSRCFELYNQLKSMGFLDEEFLYLKNILGKATFMLHAYYNNLPKLLDAISSDLGLFFGERPLGGSESAHINNIEEVEVDGKIRSIMFPEFTQHFGHTPYNDNHLKLSPHLRNYDTFMSGGYNQTQNSQNIYPANTAKISKLKFIYSKRNEDNNVLLTPNYYIFRDENQRILPNENFRKIDIVDEKEKEFIDESITLDHSTEKMIDMFSANFSNKDKNLDNDNDHDFHDDSNSGNNGNPKPDVPKIKSQPLSQETTLTPTDNDSENKNTTINFDSDNNSKDDDNTNSSNLPVEDKDDDDNNSLDEIKLNLGECIFIEQKKII